MAEPLVTVKQIGSVAVLTLNRPGRHNALVPDLLTDLLAALKGEVCRNAAALMLGAEGRSFSTGGDLLGFWQHRDTIADYAQSLVGLLNQAIMALYTSPVPVVCAVHGQVTGGSLGFLLASDRVVMSHSATITPWYGEVGFSPDGGWTALLPGVIGRQNTLQWLHSNASHDAATCLSLGLVHEVTAGDCRAAALAWAEQVCGMAPGSRLHTRRLFNRNAAEIRISLEAEQKAFIEQIRTPEAQAGIKHFLGRNTA